MGVRRFLFPGMLLLALLPACIEGGAAPADDSASVEAEVRTTVAGVAGLIGAALPPPRVCGPPEPVAPPDEIVMITAQQCYTCAGVGHLLREMRRRKSAQPPSLWVVAPAEQSAEICTFLKREKISLPVVSVRKSVFPNPEVTNDMIYAAFSVGQPVRVLWNKDGLQLLAEIERKQTPTQESQR